MTEKVSTRLCLLLLKALLFATMAPCLAAPNRLVVPHQIELVRETTSALTIEDIATRMDWRPLDASSVSQANFGFTSDTFWLRVRMVNEAKIPAILVIDYPLLDDIILYQRYGSGFQEVGRSGDTRSTDHREIVDRSPMFKLDFSSGPEQTIYLRVRSGGSMQIPVSIVSPDQLLERTVRPEGGISCHRDPCPSSNA